MLRWKCYTQPTWQRFFRFNAFNIEEADERIFVHVINASKKFSWIILIKTVDSDVVVIAVSVFYRIPGLNELWIEFGTGKSLKFIPVHEIAIKIGEAKSYALPFFHPLSGCDTTASVAGKGKKSFSDTWFIMPEMTALFVKLGKVSEIENITEEDFKLFEKFFVVLYCSTCNTVDVNTASCLLFTQGGRSIENIPPTLSALKQHVNASSEIVMSLFQGRGVGLRQLMVTYRCGVNYPKLQQHAED